MKNIKIDLTWQFIKVWFLLACANTKVIDRVFRLHFKTQKFNGLKASDNQLVHFNAYKHALELQYFIIRFFAQNLTQTRATRAEKRPGAPGAPQKSKLTSHVPEYPQELCQGARPVAWGPSSVRVGTSFQRICDDTHRLQAEC